MNCSNLWGLLVFVFCALAANAGEPERLTRDGALKLSPVFIDQGRGILFAVHDEPNRVSLIRLRLSDGHRERIDHSTTVHMLDPDESPDGRFFCFAATATSPQSILVIRDAKERTEHRFAPREARGTVRCPRISPDQQRVVFALSDPGGQQIASVDVKGTDLRRLTDSAGTNDWPSFSPDGRKIAFSSSRAGNFHLYVMDADGKNVRQLTNHPVRDIRPTWSPDGARIAFVSARDGNLEVYTINTDGTQVRRITHHPDRDDFPVWHPDGKRLLTISERDGDSDLYLFDAR